MDNNYALLNEIENINKELNVLRKKVKELNKLKKTREDLIIENMKKKNINFLKYKNQTFKLTESNIHKKKKKDDKKKDALNVLKNNGIYGHNAMKIYNDISNSFKGETIIKTKLKK